MLASSEQDTSSPGKVIVVGIVTVVSSASPGSVTVVGIVTVVISPETVIVESLPETVVVDIPLGTVIFETSERVTPGKVIVVDLVIICVMTEVVVWAEHVDRDWIGDALLAGRDETTELSVVWVGDETA